MTPALVLPSSLGTTSELWDENVGYWSGTFRLLPYTQKGRSSVEQLGRGLVELAGDSELVSICGLSLGGAAAMWVAANVPERVDRLVLACTSARFGEPRLWLEPAPGLPAPGLEPLPARML